MTYTKDTFRRLFQSEFDIRQWQLLLRDYFHADKVRTSPEPLLEDANDREGYYLGNMTTADNYNLGFFYYKMKDVSVLRRRVGLRNLVKPYLRLGIDAALAVFTDGKYWRLSLVCDLAEDATNTKRYTYVFGDDKALYKTPIKRFVDLQTKADSFQAIKNAFSVEALSDDFFDEYRNQYADFIKFLTGKRYVKKGTKWVEQIVGEPDPQFFSSFGGNEKMVRDYVKKMMGRIVFLYFLQSKGWLAGNYHYMHDLYYNSEQQDDFLDKVLEPMFFGLLNTKPEERSTAPLVNGVGVRYIPDHDQIPYLNGGLFQQDAIDEVDSRFPAQMFKSLFDFFDSYNFTIDENDPNDAEVGVDPEMLGKIFENLLEDNKDKGVFYTPKEIVKYMCQESLIAYLQTDEGDEAQKRHIANFVKTYNVVELGGASSELAAKIDQRLKDVKICDPAIGSGAFPMGLLRELYACRKAIEVFDADNAADIKRHIIQNNIYGVDIEKGAVDIARLRFWLALIIDETEPTPLPNLDFKIMQGNSLLESYKGVDLSQIQNKVKREKVVSLKGRRSKKGQTSNLNLSLVFDEKDAQKNIQNLIKKYFEITDHIERNNYRNQINSYIKDYIKKCAAGNTEIVASVDSLEIPNDKFFLWHTYFADVFEQGGFDIVIGNPPYVKEYTNRNAFNGFREISPYYMGKMDLWYGFACCGIDMLANCGILCLIAQNNWTTSSGAKKMRKKVVNDCKILQMLDFNTYMVFDNADIQTMIMLFEKNDSVNNYSVDYRLLEDGAKKDDMVALLNKQQGHTLYMNPKLSKETYLRKPLTFSNNETLFEKISIGKKYLNDKEIAQGIVFPQDFLNKKSVEILGDGFSVGDSVFGLTEKKKDELQLSDEEQKLIKPYYTSEQISRYSVDGHNTKWMIYTDSSFADESKMDIYPHIKKHLDTFQSIITSSSKPYGLHRARNERFFKGEKIISQRKCVGRPVFAYCDFDSYVTQTYFVIKSSRWNLKFLTGVLNSTLVSYWLKNKGKMQGRNLQVDKEPLLNIPLPLLESVSKIEELVDSVINIKKSNNNSDTTSLENQIDFLVYHLYDLTYDEVLVVDANPPFTREEYESYKE